MRSAIEGGRRPAHNARAVADLQAPLVRPVSVAAAATTTFAFALGLVFCELHEDVALAGPYLVPRLHCQDGVLRLFVLGVPDEATRLAALGPASHDIDVCQSAVGLEDHFDRLFCDVAGQVAHI